jgi:hypothetical protein
LGKGSAPLASALCRRCRDKSSIAPHHTKSTKVDLDRLSKNALMQGPGRHLLSRRVKTHSGAIREPRGHRAVQVEAGAIGGTGRVRGPRDEQWLLPDTDLAGRYTEDHGQL